MEQTPVNAYSDFKLAHYKPSAGEMTYFGLTAAGVDYFKNGSIPDGTLVNTVKLTYTP